MGLVNPKKQISPVFGRNLEKECTLMRVQGLQKAYVQFFRLVQFSLRDLYS